MHKSKETVYTHTYDSPIGRLYLTVDRRGAVMSISFVPPRFGDEFILEENKYACGELELELDEYFAGNRESFSPALRFQGTAFQEAVWKRLTRIPYGQTWTYGTVAQKIGRRDAARAVGNAVARNPICLLIPCHRVVPAQGGLGAYGVRSLGSDTGAEDKRWLLRHEGAVVSGNGVRQLERLGAASA
ncbi:MAG: methylated-DNA--[protein]-cysteine S-methyltransferase [Spirochaetales bacterium]